MLPLLPVLLALLGGPLALLGGVVHAADPCDGVGEEAVARGEADDCRWLLGRVAAGCGEVGVAWERIPAPHAPEWGGGEVTWPLSDLAEDCLVAAPELAVAALGRDPGDPAEPVLLAALARADGPVSSDLRALLHRALADGDAGEAGSAASALARTPPAATDLPALAAAARRLSADTARPAVALGRIGAALRSRDADPGPAVDGLLGVAETDPTGALRAAAGVVGHPVQDPRLLALGLSFRDAAAPPGDAGRALLAALGDPGRAVLLGGRPDGHHARLDLLVTIFEGAADLEPDAPGVDALLAWASAWEDPGERRYLAAQLRRHAAALGHPAAWQSVLAPLAQDPDVEVRRTALRAWLALAPRLPGADRRALHDRLAVLLDGPPDAADLARTVIADARGVATDLDDARAWLAARR